MTRDQSTRDIEADHGPNRNETGQGANSNVTPLLTPSDVAAQLKVTAEQVRSLIRSGRLLAINVGSGKKRPLYRVSKEALDEFIKAGSQTTTSRNKRTARQVARVPDFFPDLR